MKKLLCVIILTAPLLLPHFLSASFQEGYDLYKRGKYYEAEAVLLREKELSPNNLDSLRQTLVKWK